MLQAPESMVSPDRNLVVQNLYKFDIFQEKYSTIRPTDYKIWKAQNLSLTHVVKHFEHPNSFIFLSNLCMYCTFQLFVFKNILSLLYLIMGQHVQPFPVTLNLSGDVLILQDHALSSTLTPFCKHQNKVKQKSPQGHGLQFAGNNTSDFCFRH